MQAQYLKYPFSEEVRYRSQKLARDIRELVTILSEPANEYVVEAAEQRVYAALTQSEIQTTDTGNEHDVLVYTAARLIVEKIGNPRLREYQAEMESKAANKHLGQEKDTFLIDLAKSSFGWTIESMGDY